MDLEDIGVFLQIVASGSLSRAATALRKPKATVSHQLKRLEDSLGVPLFVRSANNMTLSQAGKDFHEHAQIIRRACERAMDNAAQNKEIIETRLSIASSSEFASNLMSPILLNLLDERRGYEVNVMTFPREMLADVREQYDCILYLGDPPLPQFSNMSAKLLGRFRFGLFASESYLAARGVPERPSELLGHDLLGYHDGQTVTTWRLTNGRQDYSVRPSPALLSNDYWIIKLSAIHHLGICLVPDFFANFEEAEGLLSRVLPSWSSPEVPVFALFWSHRLNNVNLRRLMETAEAQFGELGNYLYKATRKPSP